MGTVDPAPKLPDAEERIGIFARYMERQRKLAAEGKQKNYLTSDLSAAN